eukprot:718515_1
MQIKHFMSVCVNFILYVAFKMGNRNITQVRKANNAAQVQIPQNPTKRSCICGDNLIQCVVSSQAIRICDECYSSCVPNQTVYHCSNDGYNLCCKCNKSDSISTCSATRILNMGFTDLSSVLSALRTAKGEVDVAINYLLDEKDLALARLGSGCNLFECSSLDGLHVEMELYEICSDLSVISDADVVGLDSVLSDFLHLIENHDNTDEEFEFITTIMGVCDIERCEIFDRNSNRPQNIPPNVDKNKLIYQQILDKIHCFYYHCFDVGNKLTSNQKLKLSEEVKQNGDWDSLCYDPKIEKIKEIIKSLWSNKNDKLVHRFNKYILSTNIIEKDQAENDSFDRNMYSFGYDFVYSRNEMNYHTYFVGPIFSSMKEEILNNDIVHLTLPQFNNEYYKAIYYSKTIFNRSRKMPLECILVAMFYCNYDMFQCEFTKTFRQTSPEQTIAEIIRKHANYYWFARNLKLTVNRFGTTIPDGKIKSFYHGLNEKFVFSKTSPIILNSPTSTSSSFPVALNFTNQNGIVIELTNYDAGGNSAKYLSVAWLSDYVSEAEFLFAERSILLTINNIINVSNNFKYVNMLRAFRIIDDCVEIHYEKEDEHISGIDEEVCVKIIKHQLSFRLSEYEQDDGLKNDTYAQSILYQHFKTRGSMFIDWKKIKADKYKWFFDLFCYKKHEWIKVDLLTGLFPNKGLHVCYLKLCAFVMDDILKVAASENTTITYMAISLIHEESCWTASETVQKYAKQFDKIGWKVTENLNEDNGTMIYDNTARGFTFYKGGLVIQKKKNDR